MTRRNLVKILIIDRENGSVMYQELIPTLFERKIQAHTHFNIKTQLAHTPSPTPLTARNGHPQTPPVNLLGSARNLFAPWP